MTGEVYLCGKNVDNYFHNSHSVKGAIGACCQDNNIDPDYTVFTQLELFAAISGVKENYRAAEVERFLELFDLVSFKNFRCGDLSNGIQRKVVLAMALIGKSNVVILDEPVSGLDPLTQLNVLRSIKKTSKESALLMSSQ